jgi:glycogen operon protein
VLLIFNSSDEVMAFELPTPIGVEINPWRRWIDTSLNPPQDIVPWRDASPVDHDTYRAAAHSSVVLFRDTERTSS